MRAVWSSEAVTTQPASGLNATALILRRCPRPSAALLCLRLGPLLGEEVFERGEQKGSKSASLRCRSKQIILFKKFGEEGLRKILSFSNVRDAAADISIKRIPVLAAQRFQGLLRFG